MLFLDPKSGAIVFSTAGERAPGARWTLFRDDCPLAELDGSNLTLLYQGPINRLGGVGPRTEAPWALVSGEGLYPLRSDMAPIWTLAGDRTFYIESQLDDPAPDEGELAAVYADPSESEFIAVQPGAMIHFAAYCALHRAFGRMEIEFYGRDKTALADTAGLSAPALSRIPISPSKIGGTTLLDYDRCQISATVPFEAHFAQLRFVKQEEAGEGSSFLFFARPYLGYMAPAPDLSGADLPIQRNHLPSLFSEYRAKVFLYACDPPLSMFDGSSSSLRVEQELEGRSRTIGAAELTFPRITGAEILDASERSVFGRVLADGASCASFPLALCRPDRRVVSRTRAAWGRGGFVFQFVVPQDPFEESSRSFSICDATSKIRLLDFTLAA